jgi:NAD(P)H-dependent FMN reductase
MAKPKIAVISSTTREARSSEKPAKWIYGVTAARADMSVELIDLRDYPMPFFDEPASNDRMPSNDEVAQRWQEQVARFDGYIFLITNETPPALRADKAWAGCALQSPPAEATGRRD